MTIQWFPGHMAKARRELTEKLKYIDIVFELIDARLPISSRNPMLDQIIQQKPRIVLLNKADLADPIQTKKWQQYFEEQGFPALAVNAQQGTGIQKIVPKSKEILHEKRMRQQAKGLKPQAIRAVFIGIPNVGKSTIMNRLVKKNIAKTGNKPGVTKGQQWLKVGNELELLDTPGILWPKFEDPEIGKKLAVTGAIKDDLLHMDDLALFSLAFFKEHYSTELKRFYHLSEEELLLTDADLLLSLTKKRGFKEDYERMSQMIIKDIRSGKLGRYTLDRYEEMEQDDE